MFSSIAYSNDFLNLKNMQKKENTWKLKKQNFKTEKKKRMQNQWWKKGKTKREKTMGKNGHLHFFGIYGAFSICLFSFIRIFSRQKAK